MSHRQTPSTRDPDGGVSYPIKETVKLAPAGRAGPEAVELDLRDRDDNRDGAAAPSDLQRMAPVREAPHELLSRRQAAERFGLELGVLSTWEKAGRLTPCRNTPRGRVYYALAEVRRAVSETGLDVDRLDVDGLDVDRLDVDRLRADGLKADGLEADGLEVDDRAPDDPRPTAGLVLSPERLWAMVEDARRDAVHARTRASALEAEVRLLREVLDHLLSEAGDGSTPARGGEAAERARRWAAQWEQHEHQQQEQQERELSTRGSRWRNS